MLINKFIKTKGRDIQEYYLLCLYSGMKPTSGRIYQSGRLYTVRPGIGSNAGFMCRKVEGVTTAMNALLQDAKLMSQEGNIYTTQLVLFYHISQLEYKVLYGFLKSYASTPS